MSADQFVKELEDDIEKWEMIKSVKAYFIETIEDLFYDITHLWWEIENKLINLNNEQEEKYFLNFVSFILDFHDVIGFDEDGYYGSDHYDLPFEIIYNIIDWFDDLFDDYGECSKTYEKFKKLIISHFSKDNELIKYMFKIEQTQH